MGCVHARVKEQDDQVRAGVEDGVGGGIGFLQKGMRMGQLREGQAGAEQEGGDGGFLQEWVRRVVLGESLYHVCLANVHSGGLEGESEPRERGSFDSVCFTQDDKFACG